MVALSDMVLIPTRPSPHDLRAVGATVDIVERYDKTMIFVVNSATRGARITSEAAVALSQHGTVAPVTLHHRVDYAASMIDGRTVMEVREASRSSKEVIALWEYVADRLDRLRGEMIAHETPAVPEPEPAQGPALGVVPLHPPQQKGFGRRTDTPAG